MHVLSAPPAFILSQDRTLRSKTDRRSGLDFLYRGADPVPKTTLISDSKNRRGLYFRTPIAVSGFQGSPRRSDLRAARGNILGISAPRVAVIPAVHIFCTTAARGTADQLGILCLSHSSALLVLPECLFTNDTRTVNSRELPRHLVVALYRCGGHGRHGLGCLSFRPTAP